MAREAGHRGGSRPSASRPRRGRRATAAYLGRRRRDRGEGGGPHPRSLGRRRRDRGEGGRDRSWPPASRRWRGRLAKDAVLGCRRRDGGEGGWPPRRISGACVETAAREAAGRSWPPASRLWRGRLAKHAVLGRRRRDRGGPPLAAELGRWRRDRCEGSGVKISWMSKQGDQVRIISDALYYVKGSHNGNLKRAGCIDWIA